ncbi:MAG: TetR/AcrR family transcriptional regulator, partial [Actinomycetales bacterium]
ERRARLVEATVRVVGGRGEGAATMTAICAEAGLTERYFYESFDKREVALVAALDHVADRLATEAVRAIAQTAGTPTDRVHAGLSALVQWVDDEPLAARVALVESSSHPDLRARRRQLLGTFADLVVTEAGVLYGAAAWTGARGRAQGLLLASGFAELVAARLTGDAQLSAEELVDIGTTSFERLTRSTP